MGKKLSEEAKLLIKQNVEDVLTEKLNVLDEELPRIITKHLLTLNKEKEKEKLKTVEKILKNYIPLQKQIEETEKILLNKKSKSITFQNIENELRELKKVYEFIHKAIQDEKDYLEKKINDLIKSNSKYENRKTVELIFRFKGELYLLEEYYEKESVARKIKDDYYENEKKFSYDKNELLKDMYRRLSILCTTINNIL